MIKHTWDQCRVLTITTMNTFTLTCPHCGKANATAGHILGHSKTPAKGVAARENGKRGGRPKKTKTTEKL